MKTLQELKTLRAELVERRNVELYRLSVHNDDRLARITNIHDTLDAIDAALGDTGSRQAPAGRAGAGGGVCRVVRQGQLQDAPEGG